MDEALQAHLRFKRFAATGEKHAFQLRSGAEFLGWVMDVGADAVLVAWAPSPFHAQATGTSEMAPPDEWLPFADIEPASLSYWDDATRRWVDFHETEADPSPDTQGSAI
jgi:hypothetical protein